MRQSGGHIGVDSGPGHGTTFNIYFPRVASAPSVDEARAPEPRRRATETVLLVEDEAELLAIAREILDAEGYTILEAHDPDEALLIAGRYAGPIHLMVTDVVMPKMSGRQLAERLPAIRPETKVLYVSGYTHNAMVQDGMLDPGTSFIQKPFTPEALALKVRAVLDA
ncbi:MAG: response regulator [Candidatus Rokubacteria bacterium]|nr:response regulator [Candidatus Rokubacteria bacterium]